MVAVSFSLVNVFTTSTTPPTMMLLAGSVTGSACAPTAWLGLSSPSASNTATAVRRRCSPAKEPTVESASKLSFTSFSMPFVVTGLS